MNYGIYYHARVVEKECWFLVAILRSFEHLAFDRTYDRVTSTFEFFVPEGNEKTFLELMNHLQAIGVIESFTRQPNRLMESDAIV